GFLTLSEEQLAKRLRELGHRYPETRARYIVEARRWKVYIRDILKSLRGNVLREWFVKNVKGIGYKEASHFLRNMGYLDFAILDFHIIRVLESYGLIDKVKSLGKKKYLEIEEVLRDVGKRAGLTLGGLDLYLWYMETGKVLK
ncbi:MAG: N-glycosylase, partial [Candidatus Aenigmatarchaeota archaeon]